MYCQIRSMSFQSVTIPCSIGYFILKKNKNNYKLQTANQKDLIFNGEHMKGAATGFQPSTRSSECSGSSKPLTKCKVIMWQQTTTGMLFEKWTIYNPRWKAAVEAKLYQTEQRLTTTVPGSVRGPPTWRNELIAPSNKEVRVKLRYLGASTVNTMSGPEKSPVLLCLRSHKEISLQSSSHHP